MLARHRIVLLATVLSGALAAAPAVAEAPRLSPIDLLKPTLPGPWSMSSFAPPPHSSPATNVFEGRLQLRSTRAHVGFRLLKDVFGDAPAKELVARTLPAFDFEFVQSGDALIPVTRGTIVDKASPFDFILEPGLVWDEDGTEDYTRAAIPFTLEEHNENCMHNGVLSFLFRSDGKISDVAYEIASETCSYFQFNAWGYAEAHYVRAPIASRTEIIARYRGETAARVPMKPIGALSAAYPNASASGFGSATEVAPQDMTLFGVVADGTHYVSQCDTRYGPYPYCDVLDIPSYSLAKSLFAALATMRLAMTNPEITTAPIANYVSACRNNGTWGDVTIGNALDMVTGHYNSSTSMADEYAPDVGPFFLAESHADKIAFACAHYPRKTAPGSVWVYHTTDTYVLGTALNEYYRARHGANADVFREVLVDSIWAQLALSPAAAVTRRTNDEAQQAFTGYGLTLHRDDLAKLSTFISVGHGAIDGRQMLDASMLNDALRRNPTHAAYRAPTDEFGYKNGFWAWNAQRALGCSSSVWIPFMLGYGGIVVAMFPNGVTYYYVSDGGTFKWAAAAAEANKMRAFCT